MVSKPVSKSVAKGGAAKKFATSNAATGAATSKGGGTALSTDLERAKRVLERPRAENTTAGRSIEVLNAALCILDGSTKEKSNAPKVLFDQLLKNDIFSSEKFLRSLGEKDVEKDALLIPVVCQKFFAAVEAKAVPTTIFNFLSAALFWPSFKVRFEAYAVVKVAIAPDVRLSCALMTVVLNGLQSGWLDDLSRRLRKQAEKDPPPDKEFRGVSGKEICLFMTSLLKAHARALTGTEDLTADVDERVNFINLSLSILSLEKAVEHNGAAWIHWIHKCGFYRKLLESSAFCDRMIADLLGDILSAQPANGSNGTVAAATPLTDGVSRVNAVKLLVSLGDADHAVCDAIWRYCVAACERIDVERCIKMEPAEVAIFYTADGVLYNTDVIEQNADDAINVKNIKRESKVYSYKEQMAEIQLRKELAEKNRREGRLTEKQQKAVAEELKKEHVVREIIQQLYDSINDKLQVLNVAARYNPKGAFNNLSLLYDVVVPLTKSKIVAKLAVQTFLAFRDAFYDFSTDRLHELVAHVSLRVLESKHLYKNWCEEALDSQLRRMFSILTSSCFLFSMLNEGSDEDSAQHNNGGKVNDNFDNDELFNEGITARKLAFLVPLLGKIFGLKTAAKEEQMSANVEAIVRSSELRMRVANFLENVLSPNFIQEDEAISLPLLKLNTILLNSVVYSANEFDWDDVFSAMVNYGKILNNCAHYNEGVLAYLRLILDCLTKNDSIIRRNMLKLLQNIPQLLIEICVSDSEFKNELHHVIFLARFDSDSECVKFADSLWLDLHFTTTAEFVLSFTDDLSSAKPVIREQSGRAVLYLVEDYPQKCRDILTLLAESYTKQNELHPPVFDNVGRKVKDAFDDWERRSGVAKAFALLAEVIPSHLLMSFVQIIVPDGLSDRNDLCRDLMCSAGVTAITNHGKEKIDELLPFLENRLDKIPASLAELDNLRTGLIILIGTLARHLENNDAKIRKIVARLISALSTPSQLVQESVACCLPSLMPSLKSDARELIQNLIILLTNGETYGERRGAAYGIASIIKGLGVMTIKEIDLTNRLRKFMAQKQDSLQREGALLCIEMLCRIVGKLYEPYVVQLLPDLLNMFGDSNEGVRQSATDTARAMMKSLSAHGVRLVLPLLLKALDQDAWRTKCASAELLGAMSNCAPRQLSASLPTVVPKICEVLLVDTHAKVQKAGEKALKDIAKVIKNPEILAISSHLISGLVDPAVKTKASLEIIVNTKFLHYVDASSLALIMQLIRRALHDRNTDARRMAAQIISNIYSLADHKDMEPYLSDLIPGLKKAMVDPAPEVRSVASKALGSIIRYSSPETSERIQMEIMPWLKESLVSKTSIVDRSGAAQSLAEVISALGEDFLSQNMPGVVTVTENPQTEPHIRDGYLLLYIYLPIVMEEKFLTYVPSIVPSILSSLADETEYVRDSALKAGQRLISTYVHQAKKLLIPQLQQAMIDGNWRIRHASIKLIGEFLFNISGVSAKMTSDTQNEDDTLGMETVNKAIIRHIGQKCRDEIFATLYLVRHDVALTVRQAAGHVWKVVVANTPRTLKELMSTLFDLVLECLSSSVSDRQQMAARCLGEMVKKMGERILTNVLPILEERLKDGATGSRQGVAIAISEIICNTHREIVEMYVESVVPSIRRCLSDANESVREAIVPAFASFYHMVGNVAIEEVVAPMLEEFTATGVDNLLEGLCAICADTTNRMLLPSLLPKLMRPPVNSLALCRLSTVAEDALSRNLSKILEALLSDNLNTTVEEHVSNCIPLLLSIEDEDDVRIVVNTLLKYSSKHNKTSVLLLKEYMEKAKVDLLPLVENIIPGLLMLYNSGDPATVEAGIDALQSLVKHADGDSDTLQKYVLPLKRAAILLFKHGAVASSRVDDAADEGESEEVDSGRSAAANAVPGLTIARGWQPLLAVLREGLLTAPPETKEIAGIALGQLVAMSDEKGLKPHVINMTGPLIRVLGDRHPSHVKLAVLNALIRLLEKMSLVLRPFLPQMQSVFLRVLQENNVGNIRTIAGQALGLLIGFHPKPESIINELVKIHTAAQAAGENLSDMEALIYDLHQKASLKK